MSEVIKFHRHGQPGYYSVADIPQPPSIEKMCIETGWQSLDGMFRMYPGQFIVCTGIAGHGKSTFLMNVLVQHAKKNGTRTFFYVPENEGQIRRKLRSIWGGSEAEFKFHAENNFYIQSPLPVEYNEEIKTIHWVLERAIVAIKQDFVGVVMIDPWNELERAKPEGQLLTDYIGQCLQWLKNFARVHNVTVIVVAHPTKAGLHENKVPGLADIEGSMNWYNKCDNGLIVSRDAERNECKIISAKVRELGAGQRGWCVFDVDKQTGIFTPQENNYWHG